VSLDIVFMGTPDFAVPALDLLSLDERVRANGYELGFRVEF
jgi:methionyl-tRNA formyltransferase